MPNERTSFAIHATAVSIGGRGLLILGPSRSGKSRLAAALIATSSPACRVQLVGDDRVLLSDRAGRIVVRPHPRIAGFLERRGLGIVAMPHSASVDLAGIVLLGAADAPNRLTHNLPTLRRVDHVDVEATAVLQWWRDAVNTLV